MSEQFDYRATKDGKVLVSWEGRVVTTLKDERAQRLPAKAGSADAEACRLLMAGATRNFKRGNER